MEGTDWQTIPVGECLLPLKGDAMAHEGENIGYWERLAKRYDRLITSRQDYAGMIARVGGEAAGDVLEVACGTGAIAAAAAANGCRVWAVDLAENMLAEARRRCPAVDFSRQSAYRLAFEDNSFDTLICSNALHIMQEPWKALAEFKRVLRPGGKLLTPTFCHGTGRRARLTYSLMSLTGFRVYHKFSPEALRDLITAAGFTVGTFELNRGIIPMAYVIAEAN